ncbi:hypothetical protein AAC387_Pa09g1455 [Persea americana]
MSGSWGCFSRAVLLMENPAAELATRRKVLVHTPTNEVITSYTSLERKLAALGWERYQGDPDRPAPIPQAVLT